MSPGLPQGAPPVRLTGAAPIDPRSATQRPGFVFPRACGVSGHSGRRFWGGLGRSLERKYWRFLGFALCCRRGGPLKSSLDLFQARLTGHTPLSPRECGKKENLGAATSATNGSRKPL
jgi:hypothetical protein